jgi:hypothetical protein
MRTAALSSIVACAPGEADVKEEGRAEDTLFGSNPYGINIDYGLVGEHAEGTPHSLRAHDLVREAGVGWVRYWLSWQSSEPEDGRFDFALADHEIDLARSMGLEVYVTIQAAPSWPHGGANTFGWGGCSDSRGDFDASLPSCGPPGSANAAPAWDPGGGNGQSYYWRRFVRTAVQHFRGRVKHWGFYNEPASMGMWPEYEDRPGASRYREFLEKVVVPARDEALAIDPTIVIVGPEDSGPSSLEDLLSLEERVYGRIWDVISVHAYGGVARALDLYAGVLARHPPRPVWVTETDGGPGIEGALQAVAARPWVTKVFPYRLRADPGTACDVGDHLLDANDHRCFSYDYYKAFIAHRPPARSTPGASTVELADFTGDGLADIATVHADGRFRVHRNLGGGRFDDTSSTSGRTTVGGDWQTLVADFTGDGFADYANIHEPSGRFQVHANRRDGTFDGADWATGAIHAGSDWEVFAADFDGDGFADVAERHVSSGRLYAKRNRGAGGADSFDYFHATGPAGAPRALATTAAGAEWSVIVADFTGDGRADYANHHRPSGRLFIHANSGAPDFDATSSAHGDSSVAGGSGSLLVGDFTGDGRADYLDHRTESGDFWIHENLGGSFSESDWAVGRVAGAPAWRILAE